MNDITPVHEALQQGTALAAVQCGAVQHPIYYRITDPILDLNAGVQSGDHYLLFLK